jgi:hypothetical protein
MRVRNDGCERDADVPASQIGSQFDISNRRQPEDADEFDRNPVGMCIHNHLTFGRPAAPPLDQIALPIPS